MLNGKAEIKHRLKTNVLKSTKRVSIYIEEKRGRMVQENELSKQTNDKYRVQAESCNTF